MEMRTVHDPFEGKDVQISDRLVDRLRGKYASGPHLPNGNPEFGWRQFQAPPIQHEAAARIETLEAALKIISSGFTGDKIHESLSKQNLELVFTAHPTQSIRRSILKKYSRIDKDLQTMDDCVDFDTPLRCASWSSVS